MDRGIKTGSMVKFGERASELKDRMKRISRQMLMGHCRMTHLERVSWEHRLGVWSKKHLDCWIGWGKR